MGARISLTARELKKWVRNPVQFFVSLIQPLFWIILFGSAFNITNLIPSNIPGSSIIVSNMMNSVFLGAKNYISFLTPGMMSVIILFTSMFSGISIIWDRRFGFLTKLIVAPIPRDSIIISKVFSSIVKSLVQASILFIIALLIPGGLSVGSGFNVYDLLGVYSALFLLSFGFSSLFSIIVVRIRDWQTLMAITNLLNLPLTFASTALFPSSIMPDWLKTVAEYNPLSWGTDIVRTLILKGSLTASELSSITNDFIYLTVFSVIMFILVFFVSKYSFEE